MEKKAVMADFNVGLEKWEFEAYAAVKNNVDEFGQRIRDGAFKKTVAERGPKGKGLIKAFWMHREPMGLPLHMEEDKTGLFTVTKVSQTKSNEERMILMRDKVVDKMSIGFRTIKRQVDDEQEVVDLLELQLFEYGPCPLAVNEDTAIIAIKDLLTPSMTAPVDQVMALLGLMDPAAAQTASERFADWLIAELKGSPSFGDLPVGDREKAWDASAAVSRVRAWAGGADKEKTSWSRYRRAFFWFDPDAREDFGGYKLPFADVVDGKLTAMPKGIFAAAGAMAGGRGGVDLPAEDVPAVRSHISRYYAKMRRTFNDSGIVPPWDKDKSTLVVPAAAGRLLTNAIDALYALEAVLEPGLIPTPMAAGEPQAGEKAIDPERVQSVVAELRSGIAAIREGRKSA